MSIQISVVMPCLNEAATIAVCIAKAQTALQLLDVTGEIVVADNGSTDKSVEIAESCGARVVHETKKGYGHAYHAGIQAASGEYIVIGDSDDSYDFSDLGRFIEPLHQGYDLVMGSRFKGRIEKGAMPWLHRYIGNPLLTGILNGMYHTGISDAHCGMRSFTKSAYQKMDLRTGGMEFASEMVIRAAQAHLKICETPIVLHKDGRNRPPHLRSFRDGWRHLRFMLMFSPTHLYIWPGMIMLLLGMVSLFALLPGPIRVFGRLVDVHVMVLGSLFAVLGYQIVNLGVYAKIFAVTHHFVLPGRLLTKSFQYFNLERGLLLGFFIFMLGFLTDFFILVKWISNGFGPLDKVRLAILASTFIIIGAQTIFSSFFLSMLGLEVRPPKH
jgi:glycosyltransferase involved in cell wall biosynthesis